MFADTALAASESGKRVSNIRNAKTAHTTILRFIPRVAITDLKAFANRFEELNHKLVILGELSEHVLGRRLDGRILKLAVAAEALPTGSPTRQKITERIKAEMLEYFEREKHPQYDTDRRLQGKRV